MTADLRIKKPILQTIKMINYKEVIKMNENFPVKEPDATDEEYICPAASWGDMTGLIPSNNSKETISEDYDKLYPYLPKCKLID